MGLFDKTSLYKQNYEKDLKRVYDEMYNKAALWLGARGSFFDELLLEEDIPEPQKDILREGKIYLDKFPAFAGACGTLFYIPIIHCILFSDKFRMGDELNKIYEQLGSPLMTADEIYESCITINPDAIEIVLSTLSPCSLADIELLKTSFRNREKETFVNKLNTLTCDLTILRLTSSLIPIVSNGFDIVMNNFDQYVDFVYHSDTYLARSIRKRIEQGENELFNQSTESPSQNISFEDAWEIIENGVKNLKEGINSSLGAVIALYQRFKQQMEVYDFEEKYYTDIVEDPELRPHIEEWMQGHPVEQLEEQEQPDNTSPVETKEKPEEYYTLHWPTDEEFKNYPNNYNDADYFTNTIFGPAGKVDLLGIEELYTVLVGQGILKDDIETKLIFLARYSGKEIPGITLKSIEWDMLSSDREKAIGYLIFMTTSTHEFVKGRYFFYFDFNGVKKVPGDRAISQGAYSWVNRGEKSKARTTFEIELNKFLQDYQDKAEE